MLGTLGLTLSVLSAACSATRPGWEERLDAARALPVPAEEVLRFGLWLPVHARGDLVAPLRVAHELSLAGDVDGALALLARLADEYPETAAPIAARAALQRSLGFDRAAEHELAHAVSIEPGDVELVLGLAQVRLELGFATAAIEALGRARAAGCDDAELHRLRGRAWARLGRRAEARADYEAALERSVAAPLDLRLEAAASVLIACRPGRLPDEESRWALDVLASAQPRGEGWARVWLLRGVIRERSGDLPGALDAYEEAAALEPWNRVAWTQVALAARVAQDRDRLGAAVERAVALDDDPRRQAQLEAFVRSLQPVAVASR